MSTKRVANINKMGAILEGTRRALNQNQMRQSRSDNRLSGLLDRIRKNEGSKKRKREETERKLLFPDPLHDRIGGCLGVEVTEVLLVQQCLH